MAMGGKVSDNMAMAYKERLLVRNMMPDCQRH